MPSYCGTTNHVGGYSLMRNNQKRVIAQKRSIKMEVLNLVLFGCVFYIALIGVPTLCEKYGK